LDILTAGIVDVSYCWCGVGCCTVLVLAVLTDGRWKLAAHTVTPTDVTTVARCTIIDDNDCYHTHTVVFNSRLQRYVVTNYCQTDIVQLDGRSIGLEHLAIASYLSAANRINTCDHI
jgi:hypothetical protein